MDGQYIPTEIKESSNYISLLIYRDRPVLATHGIRWDPWLVKDWPMQIILTIIWMDIIAIRQFPVDKPILQILELFYI